MIITFANNKLKKQLSEEKTMLKAHGAERTKLLKRVMTSLFAAENLAIFAPPYSPPDRCHELSGNKKGQLSIDLNGPHRLVFKPDHAPIPKREEGGLDWSMVTAIKILGVENTHD